MKLIFILVTPCLAAMFFLPPRGAAAAELWEYRQEDGTRGFTDDLEKVPEKYRGAARRMDESELPVVGRVGEGGGRVLGVMDVKALGGRNTAVVGALAGLLALALLFLWLRRRRKRKKDLELSQKFDRIRKV
jgi:LPXTG-motif cell wall-anchored protein